MTMKASQREAALGALFTLLDGLPLQPNAIRRNSSLPERLSEHAMVFLRDGDMTQVDVTLGSPAQYSTVAGETSELKVISKAPDSVQDFGQSHLAVTSYRFDLQASDITRPQEGDRLMWRGVIFVIQGDALVDRDRLIWTVSA